VLIENMGMYWQRRSVWWGAGRNRGHLKGRLATQKTAEPVDFREQQGVYVLYDGFRVIYVGQAGTGDADLFGRLKQHTRDHLADRWDRFSWFGVRKVIGGGNLKSVKQTYSSDLVALLGYLEGLLITVTEPPLNKQGARWQGVQQYVQYRDEEKLGPTQMEILKKLWDSIDD